MRLSAIGAADTGFSNCNSLIISFSFATHSNQRMYTTRVSAFSFYLKKKTPAKEKQNRCVLTFLWAAPLYPRQRHAAVHSLRLSVSCSAHSHANAPELELVCNITEAPPVADEARRCWRKTRSIAPAPRAIGDYVLRVARASCSSKKAFKHCGAAIESLIIKNYSSHLLLPCYGSSDR